MDYCIMPNQTLKKRYGHVHYFPPISLQPPVPTDVDGMTRVKIISHFIEVTLKDKISWIFMHSTHCGFVLYKKYIIILLHTH